MSHTITLPLSELLLLDRALPFLDGNQKEGAIVPYELDHKTRWNISKNIKIIGAEVALWDEKRTAKIAEVSPVIKDASKESVEVQFAYQSWYREMMKLPVEVSGLLLLKRSVVYGNNNKIPGTVGSALLPVIEDDGEPVEAPVA